MKILCVFRLFTGIKKYVKYDYPHTGAVAIFEFLNYLKSKKINHKVIFFNINTVEDNFFFLKKKEKKLIIILSMIFLFQEIVNLIFLIRF